MNEERTAIAAQVLADAGYIPAEVSLAVAAGFITLLHRHVYCNNSDILGNREAVERIAGWKGPPMLLASALLKSGHVALIGGTIACVSAIREMPAQHKSKWKKKAPLAYKAATLRADEAERSMSSSDIEVSRYGEDENDQRPTDPDIIGFNEFVRFWEQLYRKRTGGPYPWRRQERHHVRRIVERCGHDITFASKVAINYIYETRERYRGWPLAKLASGATRRFIPLRRGKVQPRCSLFG